MRDRRREALEHAVLACSRGWGVFPIAWGGKEPMPQRPDTQPDAAAGGRIDWTPERYRIGAEPWQRPLTDGGLHQAVFHPSLVAELWGRQPEIPVTGIVSGRCVCVDVDRPWALGEDPELKAVLSALRKAGAVIVRTPGGGFHVIVRWPRAVPMPKTNGFPKPDGSQWPPKQRLADLKLTDRGSYILAPGQAVRLDDAGRRVGYRLMRPDGRPAGAREQLPPVDDVPEISAELGRRVAACRHRKPPERAPEPRKPRPRPKARVNGSKPVSRGVRVLTGASLTIRRKAGGGDGRWVDAAVERDGLAAAVGDAKFGRHDWMRDLICCAASRGYLTDAARERIRFWWAFWGKPGSDLERLWM